MRSQAPAVCGDLESIAPSQRRATNLNGFVRALFERVEKHKHVIRAHPENHEY